MLLCRDAYKGVDQAFTSDESILLYKIIVFSIIACVFGANNNLEAKGLGREKSGKDWIILDSVLD